MNILFYAPFTQRSRDTESLMIAFKKQGHRVIFLNQHKNDIIKPHLLENGVEVVEYTATNKNRWIRHLQNIRCLISHCIKFKIDIVYSHLEPANFIASMAQYFLRAKVYLSRHHINEAAILGVDKALYYRIMYSLAKKIIVVSKQAVEYMVEKEKIPAHKLIHINLAYDFSLYKTPDPKRIEAIREQYACEILLVCIGRLNILKRPVEAINTLEWLLKSGRDAKLLLLGSGELQHALQEAVEQKNLNNHVFFPGYVSNPLEYLGAADFLLHPSIAEASCVVIKEAGLTETPVIVCRGVGDFASYLVDRTNAFFVDAEHFKQQAAEVINQAFGNEELLKTMGISLKNSVLKNFSIEHVLPEYDKLNRK